MSFNALYGSKKLPCPPMPYMVQQKLICPSMPYMVQQKNFHALQSRIRFNKTSMSFNALYGLKNFDALQ
jgi:hypothetical protein